MAPVVRLERHGAPSAGGRLVGSPLPEQDHGECRMAFGEILVELDGPTRMYHRLGQQPVARLGVEPRTLGESEFRRREAGIRERIARIALEGVREIISGAT